ncbi:acyl-CoA reductase [Eubacterium aggregans]|nr:acyl-CoA reductase [Eubacterium aggregans]
MNSNEITYLVGEGQRPSQCYTVCEPVVCQFLETLGQALKKEPTIENKTAASVFAFWCRPGNLMALGKGYGQYAMGRGHIFHIAPANMPLFFLYTLAVGLLSGNSNVIRISERRYADDLAACRVLKRVLRMDCYQSLAQRVCILTYPRDAAGWTGMLSQECNGRMVWGGDQSITTIRRIPLPPYAVECYFPHRVSLSILDEQVVGHLGKGDLDDLARRFCNDTYAMNQLACSSPRLVLWHGNQSPQTREAFWKAVARQAMDYDAGQDGHIMARYTGACRFAATHHWVQKIRSDTPGVCRLELPEALLDWDQGDLGFGTFLEAPLPYLELLHQWDTPRLQTITAFGVDVSEIGNAIRKTGMLGGTRIIPVGAALDFNVVWDGVDLIKALSRTWGKE